MGHNPNRVTSIVLLTDIEAAEILELSVSTLRRWRCEGRGHGPAWLKMGGNVRYDLRDLEAWLNECRTGGRG